jgi:hypothetical protein
MHFISQWSYHVFALSMPQVNWNHMQNNSFPNAYTIIYITRELVWMVFISLWSIQFIITSKWIRDIYCIIHIHVVHMFQMLHWVHIIHTLHIFRLVHIVHMLHMVDTRHVHMLHMVHQDTWWCKWFICCICCILCVWCIRDMWQPRILEFQTWI